TGPVAAAKPLVCPTGRPLAARTWNCTPACAATWRRGSRSAPAQPWSCCHALPATAANAPASTSRCRPASEDTSTAEKTAVSTANSATAASATLRNASASRSPRVLPRPAGRGGPASGPGRAGSVPAGPVPSVIAGQAEPVAAAEHGHDDDRVRRVLLDLAAEVLHVRVDRPLVALELVPAHPVDQLEAGVDAPGHGRERAEYPPLGGGERRLRAAHGHGPARLVDDQGPAPEAGDAVVGRAELEPAYPVLLGGLRGQHQDGNRRQRPHFPGHGLAGHVGQPEVKHQ